MVRTKSRKASMSLIQKVFSGRRREQESSEESELAQESRYVVETRIFFDEDSDSGEQDDHELALAQAADLELLSIQHIDSEKVYTFVGTQDKVDTFFLFLRSFGVDPEGRTTYYPFNEN